jgi:hypothetical protein
LVLLGMGPKGRFEYLRVSCLVVKAPGRGFP